MTAQTRGWGTGWPRCQTGKISTLARPDGLRLPMRDEVLRMTGILVDRTEALGYNIRPGWTWGYDCRNIAGTGTASNHSWGLAVDINAPRNPYAGVSWHRRNARGTFPFGLRLVCDIPESVIRLWEANGWRWGGRYQGKADPMHFEFMGTPSDAAAYTRRLTGQQIGPRPPSLPPITGDPIVDFRQSDRDRMIRIEEYLNGKRDNSLRHFIQDQDRRTRELTDDTVKAEGEKTRLGTLKAIIQQTETISGLLDDLWDRIKTLASKETS